MIATNGVATSVAERNRTLNATEVAAPKGYKHTKVGVIPEDWEVVKLGDYTHIKHGWAFKGEYFSEHGKYILLTPGNFFEEGGFRLRIGKEKFYTGEFPIEYLLKKNDLIIAMTEQGAGLLGSPALIPEDEKYLHNQRLGLFQNLKRDFVSIKYLYYLFCTKYVRSEIISRATGTKVKHTSPKTVLNIKIPFPPLKEQQKIAQILTTWDEAISKQEALIAEKEQLKKGLMQKLLSGEVRFGAATSVAEKESSVNATKVASPNNIIHSGDATSVALQQDNESSTTKVVPLGWEEVRLEDISDFINEKILLKNLTLKNYISTENILPNFQGILGASKLPNSKNVTSFKKNEILMSNIRPYLKKVWFSNMNGGASNDIIVTRARDNIECRFLFYIMQDNKFIDYIMQGAKGVKMPRGDISLIKKYLLKLPTKQEQQKIAQVLTTVDKEIEMLKEEIEALKEQKRGLMQRLLTGEVRVRV